MISGTATLIAGCKVNLSLRITSRRDDGYHTLESLFLPLPFPRDVITIAGAPDSDGFSLSCDDPALESADNLLSKAYTAYADKTGFAPRLRVFLQKNIPHGAGLGGGSSDAAAFLLYLDSLARESGASALSREALRELALSLGADVPFFLLNRPAKATGIGDILEEVDNPVTGMHLVLVCPDIRVSTPWAFAAWDKKNPENLKSALTSLREQDSSPLVQGVSVQNDLQDVVFERHPRLRHITDLLYAHNAAAATMSGSGASLFGLFESVTDAAAAAGRLRSGGERVFVHRL